MKKGYIISFIISFVFILGCVLFPIKPKTDFSSTNITAFDKFEQNLINELQHDDYSYTEISKNSTLSSLQKQLNIKPNNELSTFTLDAKILTTNEIKNYCEMNDLVYLESENSFQIRNKFSLKRLIVDDTINSDYGARTVISGFENIKILCFNTIEETKNAYTKLIKENINVAIDTIISAESKEVVQAQAIYTDWAKKAINLSAFTDYSTSKDIVVAVLDTGINTSHEMFNGRLLSNDGKIVGLSYYSSSYTYSKNNLYYESGDTSKLSFEDDHGHGSHVAGIITQLTPSNVKILPIRILGSNGKGSLSSITTALGRIESTYSNTYHIACNNLSLGGEVTAGFQTELNSFNTVFTKLKNKNILNIVAAGNESSNTSTFVPAACDDSAIVVSALKYTTNAAETQITGYTFDSSYSNFGTSIDICAPGTKILSAYKAPYNLANTTDQLYYMDGTSMATPHVSACIALLCLDNDYYATSTSKPSYTADELESRILTAAIDYGDVGKDIYYGHGVLNMTNVNTTQTMTYTASDFTTTYDGSYHNIIINVTTPASYTIKYSLENDSTYTITNFRTNSKFKNVTNGSMPVYFQITASGYNSVTGVKNLTINKRNLTYTLENQTSTYGNPTHINLSKFSLTSGTIVSGENLNPKLATNATQSSPAGTYDITLSCTAPNYNISYNTAKLTINKRPIEITISDSSSVYGNDFTVNNSNYSITSGNLYSTDKLNVVLDSSAIDFTKAGIYEIKLKSYSNTNYDITKVTNGKHTISKRTLKITLNNQSSVYGDEINLNQTSYTLTYGSIVNSDNLNITLTSTALANNVSTYPITATYTNNNYQITFTNASYSVTKRDISLKTLNQTFTYGNTIAIDQTKYEIVSGSFAYSDKSSVTLSTTANNRSNVGSYPINLTFNSTNYNLTLTKGNAVVEQRTLTITLSPQEIHYGDKLVIDDSQYQITNGTIVNNDSFEINLTPTYNEENENYIVTATCSNNNYKIIISNNQITILKRQITISTYQYSTYGDEINLNNSNYKIVNGSIVNNDNLNLEFTTNATEFSNIGDYPISLANSNKHYNITLVDSYLKIKPKTIYITIQNQESMYGDKINLDQTKYTFNTNQLVAGSTIKFNLSTNATNKSNVGNYVISANIDNQNYELAPTSATYTITKRKIAIRIYNQTTPHTFQLNFNKEDYDLMSGSVVNGDDLDIELYTNATALSFAGDYELMATYDNANYDVTFTKATLTLEFSYVDVLMIVIPAVVVILIMTVILVIIIKRKNNKTIPLYKKWTK